MNKIINIKNKKAIKDIKTFKDKKYFSIDIKFENVHLKEINKLLNENLFDKNDLYINSVSLWELMQPVGGSGIHNYHGLNPEDIFEVLNSISKPYCVFKVRLNRYAIIPVFTSSFNEPIMVIIEIGARLFKNINANINKIVTMYPKSDIDNKLKKIKEINVLYIKK